MHDNLKPIQKDKALSSEVGRARSERLQGALFVLLLVLGAWQGIAALASSSAQRRLVSVLNPTAFLAGRTAATINFIEAHYLPADHLLRAAGGVIRWKLFGSGGPLVSVGCDDWLYLTEEGQTYRGARDNLTARADVTAQVASALKRRGIELVVAVVPDKARIESAYRCNAPRSAQAVDRLGIFEGLLSARNVPAVDLGDAFRKADKNGPVYYRTDTHWNQSGAALAAKIVAAAVRTRLDAGYAYRTERAVKASDRPGDLLKLMSLDLVPNTWLGIKLRPPPDREFPEHTIQIAHPPESNDLLAATPGDQVVLIGSSYSKNANFDGRLQEMLRAPVDNVAEVGGGFAGAASTYFRGATFADAPPRLVIWEMPERVLSKPFEAADKALATFR